MAGVVQSGKGWLSHYGWPMQITLNIEDIHADTPLPPLFRVRQRWQTRAAGRCDGSGAGRA